MNQALHAIATKNTSLEKSKHQGHHYNSILIKIALTYYPWAAKMGPLIILCLFILVMLY